MTYVVGDSCIQCKHTNCSAVCPLDAFREGPNFLAIDPFECIDCDACVAECPEDAIYPDDEVPMEWEDYIEINDQLAEEWADHVINQTKDPFQIGKNGQAVKINESILSNPGMRQKQSSDSVGARLNVVSRFIIAHY